MSTSGHDFVLEVIQKYRRYECLWKINHEDYHNKIKRNAALDDILELFRTKDPSANSDTVKEKIMGMRSSFNKVLRKIKASETTRSDPDSVHIPKFWYYDQLSFLKDQDTPRASKTIRSILDNLPFQQDEFADPVEENVNSPSSSTSSVSVTSKFKRPANKADVVLEKISRRMDAPGPSERKKQAHDAFGEHVAEKLRSMQPSMIPWCQKLINDAIFYGKIGSLNITSKIQTDDLPAQSRTSPNPTMSPYYEIIEELDDENNF